MEQSAKHGPGVDEQLDHEVQGLVRGAPDEGRTEARRQQAPGPGEPEIAVHRHDVAGPDEHAIEFRSRIAASLRPSAFPATGAELVAVAREAFADEQVIKALESLPAERRYEAVGALWDDVRM